jgi:membrane protein YdbS with pleckstrin-like domain
VETQPLKIIKPSLRGLTILVASHVLLLFISGLVIFFLLRALLVPGIVSGGQISYLLLFILLIVLIFHIVYSSYMFLHWLHRSYTIYSDKIVEQRGLLKTTEKIIPINTIESVRKRNTPLRDQFEIGTLMLKLKADPKEYRMRNVQNPNEVLTLLSDLIGK